MLFARNTYFHMLEALLSWLLILGWVLSHKSQTISRGPDEIFFFCNPIGKGREIHSTTWRVYHKRTLSINPKSCLQTFSRCVLEMCWEDPKPNLYLLLMYDTSVWHSWASTKPFTLTLIFFISTLVKVDEGKKSERSGCTIRTLHEPV